MRGIKFYTPPDVEAALFSSRLNRLGCKSKLPCKNESNSISLADKLQFASHIGTACIQLMDETSCVELL